MPKKTKREKILADHHRKLTSVSQTSSIEPMKLETTSYQFKAISAPLSRQTSVRAVSVDLRAIRVDLTKTILFAALAIIFEFGLFWLEKNRMF